MPLSSPFFGTAEELRVRNLSSPFFGTAEELRVRNLSSPFFGTATEETLPVSVVSIGSDATPREYNESTDEALVNVISGNRAGRYLWDDTNATVIQVGNGAGNADINCFASQNEDLVLGGRGRRIPLNDVSNPTLLQGGSLVGAINLALAGGSGGTSSLTFGFGGNLAAAGDIANSNGDPNSTAITSFTAQNMSMIPVAGSVTGVSWNVTSTNPGATLCAVRLNGGVSGQAFTINSTSSFSGLSIPVVAGYTISVILQNSGGVPTGVSNFVVYFEAS